MPAGISSGSLQAFFYFLFSKPSDSHLPRGYQIEGRK
uniref:Uncharacterized protein n=1 Tax=Siphoviridae sp. ctUGR26 TaxID=2825527 RepID=A0A8S5Q916_9CAUD|nr:MAG TPA: hypothetical protein [Siphoviridae sp. ctUGR26]